MGAVIFQRGTHTEVDSIPPVEGQLIWDETNKEIWLDESTDVEDEYKRIKFCLGYDKNIYAEESPIGLYGEARVTVYRTTIDGVTSDTTTTVALPSDIQKIINISGYLNGASIIPSVAINDDLTQATITSVADKQYTLIVEYIKATAQRGG